mmetsp:Transcript_88813/g.276108  ORF Transcript_88813/g.276108 Transcript_88813/m.276108 type:complete len:152 (+) Transcript_88813:37-492(+)
MLCSCWSSTDVPDDEVDVEKGGKTVHYHKDGKDGERRSCVKEVHEFEHHEGERSRSNRVSINENGALLRTDDSSAGVGGRKVNRKGTGFVAANEMPPVSSDEESETEEGGRKRRVSISTDGQVLRPGEPSSGSLTAHNKGPMQRKSTGFLS